jgi:hypothetical protein
VPGLEHEEVDIDLSAVILDEILDTTAGALLPPLTLACVPDVPVGHETEL